MLDRISRILFAVVLRHSSTVSKSEDVKRSSHVKLQRFYNHCDYFLFRGMRGTREIPPHFGKIFGVKPEKQGNLQTGPSSKHMRVSKHQKE